MRDVRPSPAGVLDHLRDQLRRRIRVNDLNLTFKVMKKPPNQVGCKVVPAGGSSNDSFWLDARPPRCLLIAA